MLPHPPRLLYGVNMPLAPISPNEPPNEPRPDAQTNAHGFAPDAERIEQDAPPLLPFRNLIAAFDDAARELYEAKQSGRARGPVTGFPSLDAELSGALLPGLHFALGVPGVGKTAFALQVATSCGCPCLYLTCEMRPLELLRRHTARATRTYLNKFKDGSLPPAEASAKVRKAVEAAPSVVLLDGMAAYATYAAILNGAEVTRRAEPTNPHFLIVVDSLHAWAASSPVASSEYERLAEHLAALKRVSALLNCPVLIISERNRQSMEKGGLSSGAGHRGIEYGGETVIELDTEKDAPESVDGEKAIDLKLSKNRNGKTGKKIPLLFNGGFQTYREKDAR